MVEHQLRRRGVRDPDVLRAMALLPRERFVPPHATALAYADEALPIASGQTISQPYIVARMTELLEPTSGMKVLEVGTGSGYQACVLAAIGCRVISIERHEDLANEARARVDSVIRELGLPGGVTIVVGDGSLGYAPEAPYEGIVVTAAAPRVPPTLLTQLAEYGRLVVPIGPRMRQHLIQVARHGERLDERDEGPCVFVPLVGSEGYSI